MNKILEKTFKNLTWFFPLHSQSLFMDLIMKNKTGLKLVTRVSLGYKTCLENSFLVIYHLGNFDNIIQSGFWIIPKIALANLCKPIQDVIIILVSSEPLILKTVERKKKFKKRISQERKECFLDETRKATGFKTKLLGDQSGNIKIPN